MHNHEALSGSRPFAAIIVAAGSGSRLGGELPKQYQMLGGRPMVLWSVDAFLRNPDLARLVVVHPPGDQSRMAQLMPADVRVSLVEGGITRSESVRRGLAAASAGDCQVGTVLIHDAARPGLCQQDVADLLSALGEADAAAPALPIADAVKRKGPNNSLETVDRRDLHRVQTPQAFRLDVITAAHENAPGDWVDDLALVEKAGASIRLTAGRLELMKVTEGDDLIIAERLLAGRSVRVGSGFDVHAFAPGDYVTICGVHVPHTHRLEGHSDADVGWHAITDAVLGAAALGDIGNHFPPSDPRWRGAASILFLQHAVELARAQGWEVSNVDLTLICERPKIGPHREAMRASTAEAMGLLIDAVSIKATTTERLGFTGRQEGIAAQAVVLLQR